MALALLTGVDWGPLAAVPLVAEFALVLCGGVVLAWLSGVLIALPLAVWSDRRRRSDLTDIAESEDRASRPARRTLAIADNWRGIVVPLGLLAAVGWVALHFVPVQTDPQQLLAPSLPQLRDIQTVQQELGFTNEIDIYLHGQVAGGPLDQTTGTPASIEWQCSTASDILAAHPHAVAEASSIGDFFIASSSSTAASSAPSCVATSSVSTTSPSPSPSPSASPSPTASSGSKIKQTTFLCELRLLPLLSRTLVMPISENTPPCPAIDEYQGTFFTADTGPINPSSARIALGIDASTVADQASLVDQLRREVGSAPSGITATPTGLAVLATTAYDNLAGGVYLVNLLPLLVVALVLWLIHRRPRRALLPLLPTVMAAGWAPLIVLALGRLPGSVGATLGSLNPLTVVLGSLVVALGTEFAVVLLNRFYEERQRGLDPNAAAAAALGGVGRAIRVSALTLGAGFAVLALSGLFPGVTGMPLISDFGLAVVVDLGLAVGAVFFVMLPVAVVLERASPLVLQPIPAAVPVQPAEPARVRSTPRPRPTPVRPAEPTDAAKTAKRQPSATGSPPPSSTGPQSPSRKRGAPSDDVPAPAHAQAPETTSKPRPKATRRARLTKDDLDGAAGPMGPEPKPKRRSSVPRRRSDPEPGEG